VAEAALGNAKMHKRVAAENSLLVWPRDPAELRKEPPRAVDLLLFTRYDRQAGGTKVERLEPLDVLQALGQSGSLMPSDIAALDRFTAWLGAVPAYRLTYSSLDGASAEITRRLNNS